MGRDEEDMVQGANINRSPAKSSHLSFSSLQYNGCEMIWKMYTWIHMGNIWQRVRGKKEGENNIFDCWISIAWGLLCLWMCRTRIRTRQLNILHELVASRDDVVYLAMTFKHGRRSTWKQFCYLSLQSKYRLYRRLSTWVSPNISVEYQFKHTCFSWDTKLNHWNVRNYEVGRTCYRNIYTFFFFTWK